MSTIENIKREIETLSPSEVTELQNWLSEHEETKIDLDLLAAIDGGKFDKLIERAKAEENAGLTRSCDSSN